MSTTSAGGGPKKPSAKHITTDAVRAAMAHRWKAPDHSLVWEVGDGTGARHTRSADAVIMGLWPSRHNLLEGVEIKVHRSDWLRELKAPEKAEAIARFCDRWWIHATPGVVLPEELPPNWGLRVYDGRIWKTAVEAPPLAPVPPTRPFLAALLRRSDQQNERQARAAADAALTAERAAIEKRISDTVDERTRRSAALASFADAFRDELGLDPEQLVQNREVRIAARMTAAFMRQDLHETYGGLNWMIRSLRDMADRASDVMLEAGLQPPDPKDKIPRPPRSKTGPEEGRKEARSHGKP